MAEQKLSDIDRQDIRQLYKRGDSTYGLKGLSLRFDVSVALVSKVVTGKKYKGKKKKNTSNCKFCKDSLHMKRVDAVFCNQRCKTNFARLGEKKAPVKTKNSHQKETKEHWLGQKFGALKIVDSLSLPRSWSRGSNLHFDVVCDCGRKSTPLFCDMTKGTTVSCGFCRTAVSKESEDLFAFVKGLFPDAELSVRGKLKENPLMEFDIWVPSINTAIEYHGLIWHSMKTNTVNKDRDYRKFLLCQSQGIRLIQIYSDDWKSRKDIFSDMLSRIKGGYGKRAYKVRPKEITRSKAQEFLDENHYLSGHQVKGSFYVGLFDKKAEMVAVSVFRASGSYVEWTRHAVKIGVRIWDAASKCLYFAAGFIDGRPVRTFSDSRIHTGDTYKAIGFENDGPSRQSYDYTNGRIRRHKFAFRVPAGVNEEKTAEQQGWYRIWDSGKTRWVLQPHTEQGIM